MSTRQAKDAFNVAMERSNHLLALYDLLCDTRQRSVRSDWASSFRELMHWPQNEAIIRVDGKDKNSILIMKGAVGISRDQFTHEYLSELLRSALVTAVSALDRYMHDAVVEKAWGLLHKKEADIPTELKKIRIGVLETKKALTRLRKDNNARPGHIVKRAIQDILHRDFTFQRPDDVLRAARMLGVDDFWGKVAEKMPGHPDKKDVIGKLNAIVTRRNQIVHEADLIRKTKAKMITVREIDRSKTGEEIEWLRTFVKAVDEVLP